MELVIKGKNVEITEETEAYIRRKITKLERHLPNMDEIKVELSQEMTKAAENRYVAQVTISNHGSLLRGEERAVSTTAAIDSVTDVLNTQIERFKGKIYRSHRRSLPPEKQLAADQTGAEPELPVDEETARIVKTKRFLVKPMSPEEAADQMELLSHNFFIFFNAENERFNVLYRRGDGNYGLIEPELD
ncbi:MAG: ribosome-associated translation inhibitor RaiA [Chloroflexota bacterium]|nr:ribosome-associated translation inhibitor RaiA [Chloroflexota bacterium]